jgi:hypothetical protein
MQLREVAKIRESATSVGSHQVFDHAMDGRPAVLTGSCPHAFTTGLKAGALAAILVAATAFGGRDGARGDGPGVFDRGAVVAGELGDAHLVEGNAGGVERCEAVVGRARGAAAAGRPRGVGR